MVSAAWHLWSEQWSFCRVLHGSQSFGVEGCRDYGFPRFWGGSCWSCAAFTDVVSLVAKHRHGSGMCNPPVFEVIAGIMKRIDKPRELQIALTAWLARESWPCSSMPSSAKERRSKRDGRSSLIASRVEVI